MSTTVVLRGFKEFERKLLGMPNELKEEIEEQKDDSGSVSLPFGKQTVVRSFLSRLLFCKIMGSHEWTSNAQQGIPPTPEQLKSVAGFWQYATMYCKRCGHISELSKRCLCKYKN